jgi:hypothetical protein
MFAVIRLGVRMDFINGNKVPKDPVKARLYLYKLAWEELQKWGPDNPPNGAQVEACTTRRFEGGIIKEETLEYYKKQEEEKKGNVK